MKISLVLFSLLLSQASFGAIKFSNYDVAHQDAIEKSIQANCGASGVVIQLSSLDSDTNFVTELIVRQGLDQYSFDEYPVTVYSSSLHGYHVTKVVCQ